MSGASLQSALPLPGLPAPTTASPGRLAWRRFRSHRGAWWALLVVAAVVLVALSAGLLAPHDPVQQFRTHLLVPPAWSDGGSWRFVLGTDQAGRDVLSRLMHGAQVSLMIALLSVALSALPGTLLGLLAAYYRQALGTLILRVMDVMMALPGLLLALVVIAILGPGLVNTMLAIAIGSLPGTTRLARAAALGELSRDYVQAARAIGAGPARILLVNVLPNCLGPLIVNATLNFSSAIMEVAALGFLGLGVQAPTPEWGTMLSASRDVMHIAPWAAMWPGLAILVTVLCVNLVGDGLRDAFDPRLRS